VPGFTVLTVPYFFQAGQSSTSGVSSLSRFMARAPPREEPPRRTVWAWGRSGA
jgi:hypothetical protein